MAEVIVGSAYRLVPKDGRATVYDKDDCPIGNVSLRDVIVSADLDANTQTTVERWFVKPSRNPVYRDKDKKRWGFEKSSFVWTPYEQLNDVTGYATQDDAVEALVNGRWLGWRIDEGFALLKARLGEKLTEDDRKLISDVENRFGCKMC